jgi:alpha-1,3-rhamnosyl/mannosyltransferase
MVHDLTFVHFPQTTTRAKRSYYRLMVGRSVRRAERIFVSTRTVAEELRAFAPEVAHKIRLTPEGVAPTFLAHEDESEMPRVRPLAEARSFLFVGTLEPRKNLERLLKAHGNLCRQDPHFPALRIVGGKGWEDAGIRRALEAHGDPSRLLRLGYCSVTELKSEYDRALALVFPSLYEGFGLPVLEAMTRGCPVITSRGTATEEVAGGAALLVDPLEVGEIEAAMARLARDLRLVDELRSRGRERAREFRWSRCAELTLEGLREAVPNRAATGRSTAT